MEQKVRILINFTRRKKMSKMIKDALKSENIMCISYQTTNWQLMVIQQ